MSNSNFTGKVITVTGAATGIGLEVVKILAACGAKISVCDINKEGLEKFEDWYGKFNTGHQEKGGLIITHVDVTQSDQVNAWIKKTVDHFGRLDGAVNLAGVWGRGAMVNTIAEIKDDDWAHTISVNLTGMMYSLRAELNSIEDGGSIVCASSPLGSMGYAKAAAYCASKHGLNGLVRTAAKEFGHRRIRINSVAPGLTNSHFYDGPGHDEIIPAWNGMTAFGRLGECGESAKVMVYLLSDEASFATGASWAVDGGAMC